MWEMNTSTAKATFWADITMLQLNMGQHTWLTEQFDDGLGQGSISQQVLTVQPHCDWLQVTDTPVSLAFI